MKKIHSISFFVLLFLFACSSTEITETTTTTTTSSSKTLVKIEVVNTDGVIQKGISVDLCGTEITDTKPTTIIKTVVTGTDGIATFDLESYITTTPKTLYFGVFKSYGNDYILSGKCKVEYLKKGTEYKTNLTLLK